ncbi:MAG: hypothetical protein ACXWFS_07945, partial [Thermoanaerobaculia bacterium]
DSSAAPGVVGFPRSASPDDDAAARSRHRLASVPRTGADPSLVESGTCPSHVVRFADLVLAAFNPVEGRYRLVLRGEAAAPISIQAEGYAPERLIGPRPLPRRLLPGPVLARLLPAFRD